MRVEVPSSDPSRPSVGATPAELTKTTTSNVVAFQNNVLVRGPGEQPSSFHSTRTVIDSLVPSMVSANVVGLPSHPRQGSVPSSRNGFTFSHPRNLSEPSIAISHTRYSSNPSAVTSGNGIVTSHESNLSNVRNFSLNASEINSGNGIATSQESNPSNIRNLSLNSSGINGVNGIVTNNETNSSNFRNTPTGANSGNGMVTCHQNNSSNIKNLSSNPSLATLGNSCGMASQETINVMTTHERNPSLIALNSANSMINQDRNIQSNPSLLTLNNSTSMSPERSIHPNPSLIQLNNSNPMTPHERSNKSNSSLGVLTNSNSIISQERSHKSNPSLVTLNNNQSNPLLIALNNTSVPQERNTQSLVALNTSVMQDRNASIVSILNHQRHSSFAGSENNNVGLLSLRSASVPKTLIGQKIGESSVTTLNVSNNNVDSGTSPMNISNVDVNFYRAIPCNVVSNLPTIHCVNTTDDLGNNVSNVNIVQAMPQSIQLPGASTSGSTFISSTSPKHITTVAQINGNNASVNRTFLQPAGSTVTTQVTVHNESISTQNLLPVSSASQEVQRAQNVSQNESRGTRTFTSTEAQTDDTSVGAALVPARERAATREQRRRERRERRHQRRLNNHQHGGNLSSNGMQYSASQNNERLPDILNHMPPPYSPVLSNLPNAPVVPTIVPPNVLTNNVVPVPSVVGNHAVPFPPPVVPGQVPLVQGGGPVPVAMPAPSGFRFPFPTAGFRRSRFSEEPPKGCCSFLTWRPGSLRWFIALIALVAVCCVLVGTALGAMRPAGRDHLTVSLLMIGVGIVLVTVSGVAWRLTSHDSSTCRAMLGLGSTESVDTCPRRFVPRLPPSYGRPHHPYAAMMYPEFQYRPPPPSYQASMQEYRLRLLLLDRGNAAPAAVQNGVSPPPTYRSHAGSLLRAPLSNRRDASQSEYSFPPSYRSQTSSSRPATIDQLNNALHSREQSLSLSESNHGGSVVNNVNILTNAEEDIALDNITIDSLKMVPESEINPVKMLLKSSTSDLEGSKDGNLVTIVQTGDQNPVIVTVSGCSQSDNNTSNVQITEIPSEMEILAHL